MASKNHTRMFVIQGLAEADRDLSANELSVVTGITVTTVYKRIYELEREGIVVGQIGKSSTTYWSLRRYPQKEPRRTVNGRWLIG